MENRGCSFTGHRAIPDRHYGSLVRLLQRAIEYAYGLGCRNFYAGGAVGFDTLAAREVLRYRVTHPDVRLVLLLPCINQNRHWSASDTDAYEYILSEANEVVYLSEEYTDGCMQRRNMALAEACDIMIAYVGKPRSGAAQTVRMAERLGRRVYNLYSTVEKDGEGEE